MDKCSRCLLSRPVISENGMHYNCSLSDKAWFECAHGIKDHSFPSIGKTIEFGKITLKMKEEL